jgi:hypothetical protein
VFTLVHHMMLRALFFAAILPLSARAKPSHYHSCTFNFTGGARLPHPFCDASLDIETRVSDLLSRMVRRYATVHTAQCTHTFLSPSLSLPLTLNIDALLRLCLSRSH